MNIGIDGDSTLYEVGYAWARYYATHAEEHDHSEALVWPTPTWDTMIDICRPCADAVFQDLALLLEAELMPGAREALHALRGQGHKLYLISTRSPWLTETGLRLLRQLDVLDAFEQTKWSFNKKIETCRSWGIDLMLDDGPHNVEDLRAAGVPCWVFDQPYNRHLEGPRALDWAHFVALLTDDLTRPAKSVLL